MINITRIQDSHVASVQEYASDARVAATSNVPHPYPSDGAARFLQITSKGWAENTSHTFAILYKNDFAGIVSLDDLEFGEVAWAEVGYWVAFPFWRKGIASEAVHQIIDHAHQINLDTLFSGCLATNLPSARVLQKNGFVEVGQYINDGRYGEKSIGQLVRRFRLDFSVVGGNAPDPVFSNMTRQPHNTLPQG